MGSSCKDLQIGQLLRNHTLSQAGLIAKIKECPPEICGLIYGPGSTDLTSIGALMSVAIQLVIALIYWFGVLLFNAGIIPLLQGRGSWPRFSVLQSKEVKNQYALIKWLSHDHQSSAWHQLLFTFALSIACLIRQTSRSYGVTGVFESCSIIFFLSVSGISVHITTISYYGIIKRKGLFMFGYMVTFACAVIAILCPIWLAKTENVLDACEKYANETDAPWKSGAIGSFHSGDIIRNAILIVLIPVSFFLWLWLRRSEAERSATGNVTTSPLRGANSESEKATFDHKSRILYVLVLHISVFHVGIAFNSFEGLVVTRQSMNVLLENNTEQNNWGIGQIAAPFVWAPLLIEMAYSALGEGRGSDQQEDVETRQRE